MAPEQRALLDVVAVAATVLASWAAGSLLLRSVRPRLRATEREPQPAPIQTVAAPVSGETAFVEEAVAGLLLLHVLLAGLDLFGMPWHRGLLAALGLGALAAAAWSSFPRWRRARDRAAAASAVRGFPDLGDTAAAIAVLAFALACWFLRSPFSDFVYHWGLKAKRCFLGSGTDFEFLARAANAYLHPDYPNLLPELFAVPAILSGRFHEPALLLLSAFFLSLLVLLLRAELRAALEGERTRQLALAAISLAVAAFCIGYYQAGSADLPFALAVLLGASALREPRAAPALLRGGLAAALAAALKIEGPPFALLLLAMLAWRHRRALAARPALLGIAVAPAALVVGPWAAMLARFDLYQPTNSGGLGAIDSARLGVIAENVWRVLLLPQWHGTALLLLVLPLLLPFARSRAVATLCLLQLAFYLFVYATAPLEPGYFVLSSFPRLVLHLFPATALAVFAALGGPQTGAYRTPRGAAGASGAGAC
jgi:hypothetical protein